MIGTNWLSRPFDAWNLMNGARRGTIVGLVCTLILATFIASAGCVADSDQKTRQSSDQRTATPATTAQNTDTQGVTYRLSWTNSSPGEPFIDEGPVSTSQPVNDTLIDDFKADIASVSHRRSRVGYMQNNFFNFAGSGGGTTPTVSGSSAATGTGSQVPSQDGRLAQDQTTRAGVTGNLANTPGGVANLSGSSGAGEGSQSNNQDAKVDQRIAKIEDGQKQTQATLSEIFKWMQANPSKPAEKPPTPPAGTQPSPDGE